MSVSANSSPPRRLIIEAKTDADVQAAVASNTTILEIDVSQIARLAVEIRNTGGFALDAFRVDGKVSSDGAYVNLASLAAAYTSPSGLIVAASGDLTVLASGATGWLVIDVLGFNKIRFQASSNGTITTVGILAGGS